MRGVGVEVPRAKTSYGDERKRVACGDNSSFVGAAEVDPDCDGPPDSPRTPSRPRPISDEVGDDFRVGVGVGPGVPLT